MRKTKQTVISTPINFGGHKSRRWSDWSVLQISQGIKVILKRWPMLGISFSKKLSTRGMGNGFGGLTIRAFPFRKRIKPNSGNAIITTAGQ
jgi:hypothetical protein